MKTMFIVYHDLKVEARSQEMLEVAKEIGDAILVSYSKPLEKLNFKYIKTGNGRKSYFAFLRDAFRAIRMEKPEVIILHDNYTAIFLYLLRIISKETFIIYDSSELYIDRKYSSLKLKIARHMDYFEKRYIKNADLVIAANIERAKIMKDYFKLKRIPIVFDNIHRIDENYNEDLCKNKYNKIFEDKKFYIVYGGGIAKHRFTYELAKAMRELKDKYQLIIVGNATDTEKQKFKKFIVDNRITNVCYLGFVPRSEWRYLLKKANLSVSAFVQDTVNNTYCASGKLYESLFEGTPILTSENPPLKRICEEYKVGVSTNNFCKGILQIENNYDYYCNNVKEYIDLINYDNRISELVNDIKKEIHI